MPTVIRLRSWSNFRLGLTCLAALIPAVIAFPYSPPDLVTLENSAPAPPPPTPERIERGRVLYGKHCASCHGPSGAGDGKAGHDLDPHPTDLRDPDVAGKSEMKLYRQITRGRAPMPSFGRLMNDDDRWTVVVYVKTLGKGK